MPQFDDHIRQAQQNLLFLESINAAGNKFYDWQVTVCFYAAVHLINAHLSRFDMQYRKHVDVKDAINPKNPDSIAIGSYIPEGVYLAYAKLQSLARRSRYLVNEKDGNLQNEKAFLTFEVHLARALRHLNTLIGYIQDTYHIKITPVCVNCPGIAQGELRFVCK